MAAALLLGALAGCQAHPPDLSAAHMAFDRPFVRRDPATVPRSGSFPAAGAGRAAAVAAPEGAPAVRGRVVASGDAGDVPIEGALVSTSDGRSGLTDAEGRYAIPGALPADGGLVASHPDYVASAVAGLAGGDADLHLRPRAALREGPGATNEEPFPVTGRVVDPAGAPVAGAFVVLEDARGAFSAPAVTGGDGRFVLTVFAPGRTVEAGTVLVASEGWVGARAAVATAPDAGEIGDVAVAAAGDPVAVAVDASALPGVPVRTELALRTADGASIGLPGRDGTYRLAALPGATYELRAAAVNPAVGASSELRRPVAPGEARVDVALLAPPGRDLDPAIVLNEALAWSPVPGAKAYQVSLSAIGGTGFLWEGFAPSTTIPLSFQDDLPDGVYALALTAWDAEGLDVRRVMAVGPRALRLPEDDPAWRRSTRQFRVEIS
jgi:hypothetical protein